MPTDCLPTKRTSRCAPVWPDRRIHRKGGSAEGHKARIRSRSASQAIQSPATGGWLYSSWGTAPEMARGRAIVARARPGNLAADGEERPLTSPKMNATSPLAPAPTLRLSIRIDFAQTRARNRREGCGVCLSGTSEPAPRRPRRGCQGEAERRWPVRRPFQERSPKGKPHTPEAGDWIAILRTRSAAPGRDEPPSRRCRRRAGSARCAPRSSPRPRAGARCRRSRRSPKGGSTAPCGGPC